MLFWCRVWMDFDSHGRYDVKFTWWCGHFEESTKLKLDFWFWDPQNSCRMMQPLGHLATGAPPSPSIWFLFRLKIAAALLLAPWRTMVCGPWCLDEKGGLTTTFFFRMIVHGTKLILDFPEGTGKCMATEMKWEAKDKLTKGNEDLSLLDLQKDVLRFETYVTCM
jgi:hypothetical protein